MNLGQVKKLVNLNTISEDVESCEYGDLFQEDVELLVMELEHSVWNKNRERSLTTDAEEYLEKLQRAIRKELLNTLKNLKYRNLEV